MSDSGASLELMSSQRMLRSLNRFSRQIIEDNTEELPIVIIGIDERGGYLAKILSSILDREISASTQWTRIDIKHGSGELSSPVPVDNTFLVLIDDVIFSGKTMFTAFRNIMDRGTPGTMKLSALIDRGHRKYPLYAEYIGSYSPTKLQEHVECRFTSDGKPRAIELMVKAS